MYDGDSMDRVLVNKWTCKNLAAVGKKKTKQNKPTTCIKINSKYIIGLKIKHRVTNLLEESIGKYLYNCWLGRFHRFDIQSTIYTRKVSK